MQQISEFVVNNLMLFAALAVVLVLLIKTELDFQSNKGLLLSPAMAIRLMNNNSETLVLDLRTAADYKKGHITGSKSAPLNDLAGSVNSFSSYKDKPVLVYCNSGNTATKALNILKKAGFEKVNNLEGGIAAWREANMPLVKK
jgi:rhodanese-related sulfurtransferase